MGLVLSLVRGDEEGEVGENQSSSRQSGVCLSLIKDANKQDNRKREREGEKREGEEGGYIGLDINRCWSQLCSQMQREAGRERLCCESWRGRGRKVRVEGGGGW